MSKDTKLEEEVARDEGFRDSVMSLVFRNTYEGTVDEEDFLEIAKEAIAVMEKHHRKEISEHCEISLTQAKTIDRLQSALYSWLTYMDSHGYTDKQYRKGELRKVLKGE